MDTSLTNRIGFYCSLLFVILFIIYAAGLIVVAVNGLPIWSNAMEFYEHSPPVSIIAYTSSQIMAFFLGPVCLMLFCCLHECSRRSRKILTRFAALCMVALMTLGNQMYYVHFCSMRQIITGEAVPATAQFIQWNPGSFIAASGGGLGWAFFSGLGFIAVSFAFEKERIGIGLKRLMFISGIFSLSGGIGMVTGTMILMGIYFISAVILSPVVGILLINFFKRLLAKNTSVVKQ